MTTAAPLPKIPPGKRFHKTVSPSQLEAYKKCPRRWYNASVLYDREPSKGFQLKGDAIHKALEIYGQTGEVVTSVKMMNPVTKMEEEISTFAFVQAAIPFIKPPANDPYWDEWKGKGPNGSDAAGLMLEQQADMATWADYDAPGGPIIGPNWTQFIDRVEAFPDSGRIVDYKTTSDFRYAKKPEEFKQNTQLMANARWLFQQSDYKEVEIGHLYLGTKTKTPKALPVFTTVTRDEVEELWARDLELVKEMVTWAATGSPTADPLPPNTASCGDYGGCYYREKCGFDSKGQTVHQIRPFGQKPPEVSTPLFPITIPARTTISTTGSTSMDTATATPAPTGLLATLMAKKLAGTAPSAPAASTVSIPPGPSASPPPAVGLVAPKANPFGAKPVVGLVVPATGTPPAAAPKGFAGLLAKKAAPAPVATEAAVGAISPPDAAPDTSTAEEVAAANPVVAEAAPIVEAAPETPAVTETSAEAPKGRRGRPPGSKNKTAEGQAAAPETTSVEIAPAEPTPTETVTLGAPPAGAPAIDVPQDAPVDGALQAIRDRFAMGDPNFACGTRFLFVDCLPGKGWPTEHAPVDLDQLMHAFQGTAASSANALDYRLIRYEQKAYLCMAIRVLMKGLPIAVHVNTHTPGAAEFLAEVTPYAEMIFRGTR